MGVKRSTVPRRQLGRYLKQAREEAGMGVEPAARDLEWSRARMYRIEAGQTSVRTHDVLAMCRLYGVSTDLTDVLVGLARESKSEGWWQAYGDVVPHWFELYVGMEAAAGRLRNYDSNLIPGLLQTPEYAEAVFRLKSEVSEQEIRQKVALRLERQRILKRRRPKAPQFEAIIDEAVLRRPIPDRQAMARQLAKLVNISQQPSISVRVLPYDAGPHRGSPTGAFHILDFPRLGTRPPEPSTVYSENITGALYLDKPHEVAEYEEVWRVLEERALDRDGSDDLIGAIIKESADD